ncbi:MAG: GNAT family N-acetyltransferase, partial [Chloroflexi bacterium]
MAGKKGLKTIFLISLLILTEMPSPLDLLSLIYPGPREAVEEAQRDGALRALHTRAGPDNPGAFALIDRPDFVVSYLSFATDLRDDFIPLILDGLQPYIIPGQAREVCCNVNGRNPRAIHLVQSLGFRLDMHGAKLAYRGPRLPMPYDPAWRPAGYRPGTAPAFAALLDRAYQPILQAIGGEQKPHTRDLAGFTRDLETLESSGGVYAFWIGERLAAACLVRGDYIRDLAVDPACQNQGLGSAVLAAVVNDRLAHGASEVRLDVALANRGAQRFYARHG